MNAAELKQKIDAAVDANRSDIERIAQTMFSHPELGYKEHRTTELVATELEKLGLVVETPLAVTGVRAQANPKGKGPTLVIMGELDALVMGEHPGADPETGAVHACGHNHQIGAMMGAAIALVKSGVLEQLDGRIQFLAVPAEEYIELDYRGQLRAADTIKYFGGKQELIYRGVFDDVDAAMMIHSLDLRAKNQKLLIGPSGNGFVGKNVHFVGVPAHAGAAPEKGVNALNAAMLSMMNIHALRETFPDDQHVRVHPIITKGGAVVNIVPSNVCMESYVRALTTEWIERANEMVTRALFAGAMAIGATVEVQDIPGYLPLIDNPALDDVFASNALRFVAEEEIQRGIVFTGSFDIGDLSHIMPVLHPMVGGVAGDLHAKDFHLVDPEIAYLLPARIMAMSAVDLMIDGASGLKRIRDNHTPAMTKAEYLAFLDTMDRTVKGP